MTALSGRLRAVALALVMVASLFAVANVGVAAPGDPSAYAVTQGGNCWEVTPLGDGTQNVSEFYDYRTPDTNPSSNFYASFGTTHFQENQVSQLFLYNGSEGVSLVMLHDKMRDGPNGSTITFDLSGLPESREWAVEDDDYTGRDDEFIHGPTASTIHWKWAKHRTDGAAVRGLADTANYTAVEIEPGFNEDATYWGNDPGDWPYSGDPANRTDAWKLVTEPGVNASTPGNKVTLDMSQNVTVAQGSCPDTTSPTADLQAPGTVEEGADFTLDASGSTDDEGIVSYEWDFDGDGSVDATTTSATITHNYSQNGTYDATVTVSDDAGNNDTATETITVVESDDQPPSADLTANPADAEVNETAVAFDAGNSTDNAGIVEYRWDFDGDGAVDRTTGANATTYTYGETGQFDATVTVVDAGGNEDTATAPVNVSDTTAPVARADVPDTVANGSTFQVDGSASTDNGEIASYEWDFGDGTTAMGPTATHSYDHNSTYTVTLTVTDAAGNRDSTTAQVTVNDGDTQPPSAVLDAPSSATVGETVTLDASGSSDDEGIVEYRWDFDGDGTVDATTASATTTHSYGSPGTYDAAVTVVDGDGKTDTATETISVEQAQDPPENQPPDATFVWERTAWDDKIHFDASGSSDPDGGIVRYNWSVVNSSGWHQSGEEIYHQYGKFGTYEVTLKVWDDDGATDTMTKIVTVTDRTDPSGAIDAPGQVRVGQEFTAKAVDLSDNGQLVHVCWFVDGKEVGGDFQKVLQTSFDEPGEHTIELRLADAYGNDVTLSQTVTVVANSGGGGGGGGHAGDDDPETSVDDTGDDVHVTVNDANGNEPLTIELPTGAESGEGLAALDSITVTLTHDGDYDVTIRALAEVPDGVTAPTVESAGFEPLSYLVVEPSDLGDDEIADAGFTFTIPRERLDALGADPTDVQIYRYDDGSWAAVETAVIEEHEDAVRFRASDAGLSTYVVAIDRPVIGLADLSVDATDLAPGGTVEITATVSNDGRASEVVSVELSVDGETVATRDMTVGANGERSITFEWTFEEPGTHAISVNGQTVEVVVRAAETPTPTPTATPTEAPPTTPGEGQPGFGAALAVLALLGAALLARRR